MSELADGYYWAAHVDGATFIVLREGGLWYCCGVEIPIIFLPSQHHMPGRAAPGGMGPQWDHISR
jgi:hypothetical protein